MVSLTMAGLDEMIFNAPSNLNHSKFMFHGGTGTLCEFPGNTTTSMDSDSKKETLIKVSWDKKILRFGLQELIS